MTTRDASSSVKASSDVTTGALAALPRVKIVKRSHPHVGEYGRFTGKVITMNFGKRKQMAEVKLEHCQHGTDGCFVSKGDVRAVNDDDQYI